MFKKKLFFIKIPLIIGAPPPQKKHIPLLSGRGVSGHNGQSPSVVVDEGEDQGTESQHTSMFPPIFTLIWFTCPKNVYFHGELKSLLTLLNHQIT